MFKLILLSILLLLPATHTNSRIAWKRPLIRNIGRNLVQETAYSPNPTAKVFVVAPEKEAIVKYGVLTYTLSTHYWCNNSIGNFFFVQHSLKFLRAVKKRLDLGCTHTGFDGNSFDGGQGYKELATGELDILTEPIYVGLAQMGNVSILYPHDKDDLCFLIGPSPPSQLSLLLTVPPSIWLATAACVLGFVAAAGLGLGLSWADAAFAVLGSLITGASQVSLRHLCLWVSLLSFFLWNFIGGSLTGSIVSPGREREFRTLEEVDAAFARVHAPPIMDPEYLQWLKSQSNIYASLISKFSDLLGLEGTFNPKEEVILTYETLVPMYKDNIDIPLIQTSVCLFTPCYVAFPVRKNWPHAKTFDKLIQRSVQVGLLKKYKQEACAQVMMVSENKLVYCSFDVIQHSISPAMPVQLNNLKEAFFILGIGLSLALACFLIENRSRIL